MDGVVRAPSLFSITRVVLPSMMETQLLVVPRSMPMIFPMFFSVRLVDSDGGKLWISWPASSPAVPDLLGRAHGNQCWAQHTLGDQVALLQHRDHGVGLLCRGHHADGLVHIGVEL